MSTAATSPSTDPQPPTDAPVVVGVDDSPEGVAAARYGVQAAALSGREVWLFHAYDQASTGIAPASAAKRLGQRARGAAAAADRRGGRRTRERSAEDAHVGPNGRPKRSARCRSWRLWSSSARIIWCTAGVCR